MLKKLPDKSGLPPEKLPEATPEFLPELLPDCLLLQLLALSNTPRTKDFLTTAANLKTAKVDASLARMAENKLIIPQGKNTWKNICGKEEIARACACLRLAFRPGTIENSLGHLTKEVWVDYIEIWLSFLDRQLKDDGEDPRIQICLELTVDFFLQLGRSLVTDTEPAQSKKFLETVLLVQVLCLANKKYTRMATPLASLYYEVDLALCSDGFPLYMDMIKKFTMFSLSKGSISKEMMRSLHSLEGAVSTADYPALLRHSPHFSLYKNFFSVMESINGNSEMQLFSVLATGLSHIAMHMRNFSLSEYIYRALLDLVENKEENAISLIWRCHYCFILLRQDKLDLALEQIDFLHTCANAKQDPMAFASTARGLAMYHFLMGNAHYAHTVLLKETQYVIDNGIPHASFLDPMNFDMLYVFEQLGYSPIPHYELDALIDEASKQSSQLMQGAALRIKALRLRQKGAPPHKVINLLRESKGKLHAERDMREMVMTLHELANTLTIAGEYKEARKLRKIINAHIGAAVDPDTPYSVLFIQTVRLPNKKQSLTPQPQPGKMGEGSIQCYDQLNQVIAFLHSQLTALSLEGDMLRVLHNAITTISRGLNCDHVDILRHQKNKAYEVVISTSMSGESGTADKPATAANTRTSGETKILGETKTLGEIRTPEDSINLLEKSNLVLHPGVLCNITETVFALAFEADEEKSWIICFDSGDSLSFLSIFSAMELNFLGKYLEIQLRSLVKAHHDHTHGGAAQRAHPHASTGHALTLGDDTAPKTDDASEKIIGDGMKLALMCAETVASSEASILIQGETGVGKEIVAKHLHALSGRTGPFVAIHPASTSESLFESEFFGHERGAFTGASFTRKGYFEEADGGTLFIDEVGDIPPLMQTKLLRVLQEKQYRRVGSNFPHSSNFRLITATNKNLMQEVEEGRFRLDLLFRISVIPLEIPALRDRQQDILPLVSHYMDYFSRVYNLRSFELTKEQQKSLLGYAWPGNVRELKNTVERAILEQYYSSDFLLYNTNNGTNEDQLGTLEELYETLPTLAELEKRYLQYVLQVTNGQVRGEDGAAELLNIKTSTLYAKLKRLGV